MYNGKKAKASTAMAWLSVLLYECEMQLSLIAGKKLHWREGFTTNFFI